MYARTHAHIHGHTTLLLLTLMQRAIFNIDIETAPKKEC